MNIAGCILAGGKNSRMGGEPKAFIEINGQTIIDKTLGVFKSLFDEIIIVTNNPVLFDKYQTDCIVVSDIIKNAGPLGGIHTGLNRTTKEAVFFAACDMPNLHNELIVRQIDFFRKSNCQACVVKIDKFTEPLHGIYKKELAENIRAYISRNRDYSLRSFLKTVKTACFEIESIHRKVFRNINTPDDLR